MGKFTNPYTLALKLFGAQLIVVFASVMFLPTFYSLIDSNTGMKIYSSVTALVLLSTYYSNVWHSARKDAKHVKVYNKHNEDQKEIKYSKSVLIGVLAAFPNIIAVIALTVTASMGRTEDGFIYMNMIYRVLQSPFMGWLGNDNLTYIPNCYIVTIIPILLTIPAYITGTKEFSLAEKYLPKIVYKKQPKKDKKKNK